MRTYIAVGHGMTPDGTFDPGATSGTDTEQSSGDVIVAETARLLAAAGVDVMAENNTDDPNFHGTVKAANRWGADLLVAVHHDWSGGLDAHGFWYPRATVSEQACRAIIAAMSDRGHAIAWTWVRPRNLHVLRESKMPATLIEVGQIGSGPLDTDAERRQMGAAIAAGIADFAGITLEPIEPVDPVDPVDNWTETLVENLTTLFERERGDPPTDDTRRAQGLLAAAGALSIVENIDAADRLDGMYGPSTEAAVRQYQRHARLTVDGIIGRQTWTALLGGTQ